MHKTNLDNAYQLLPACYKNFYVYSRVVGDFKYYNQKSLAYYLKISLLLHSTFINSTGIVNNPLNASTELGTLGRQIGDLVLFGQGNHHKAMPSTQSQCNLTRTGVSCAHRQYKFPR